MNRLLSALRRSWRNDKDRWLLAAAALSLVASLLHPGWPMQQALFDQIVILDVTQSMNVEDQQLDGKPASRLLHAKHALRQALVEMPCGSRIGWGIFTEYRSFLLFAPVEVCANLNELRSTLDRIDGRMAWTGNSEIAKGLYSGIGIARQLPEAPSLLFITDGQEAPPINPQHRPPFNGKQGEVQGLLVGVGDLKASRIPKTDPLGRPLGFWAADEVAQVDPRSQGRGASVGGEKLVEDGSDAQQPALPGATPGSEHLSSLREAYLQILASETGLRYVRLQADESFVSAMTSAALSRPVVARADFAPAFAALAFLLLLARHASQLHDAWRRRFRPFLRTDRIT